MARREVPRLGRYVVAVAVLAVRYGIPAALILAGQVILIATADPVSWAGFTGAGLAILLIGVLVRSGSRETVSAIARRRRASTSRSTGAGPRRAPRPAPVAARNKA